MRWNGMMLGGSDLTGFSYCRPTPIPKQGHVFPVQVRFRAVSRAGGGLVVEGGSQSLYEVLEIPVCGSVREIKQAYKQMARKYHPDVSPPDRVEEYTERFIQVHKAYQTLSDPRRKAMYDRDMGKGLALEEEKSEWRRRWQSQLSDLKRRRNTNNISMSSWGARMRSQRERSNHHE